MKIVILDHPRENPGEIDWSAFEKYGEVTKYARTLPEQVAERIGDADIVFLNKTVVTKEALEKPIKDKCRRFLLNIFQKMPNENEITDAQNLQNAVDYVKSVL